MKNVSKIIWIVALIAVVVLISMVVYGYYRKATLEVVNPVATMEVQDFGTIKMELYPEYAPETVANFIALSNRGFYDGLTFHRIVKDFMIQGGDKNGDGTGSASISNLRNLNEGEEDKEYTIKGEFTANKVDNKLKFEEGILAMARSDYSQYSSSLKEESYNSGSSQFFIMTKENSSLNGQYTAFGKVIEGMDIVHKIEEVEVKAKTDDSAEEGEDTEESSSSTEEVSTPVNPPVITSIRVETNGTDYGLPETLEPFDYMSWMYKNYNINSGTSE